MSKDNGVAEDYVEALQTTLAAEHAALFVTGYLGAQTSQSATPRLFEQVSASYLAHRSRRDDLIALVRDLGATPVASAPSYDLPDAGGADDVAGAALLVERRCARTYDALVAHSPGDQREWAIGLLIDAAVRGLEFGGEPEAFPGR